MNQDEVADAGGHRQAKFRQSLSSPDQPLVIVSDGFFNRLAIVEGFDGCQLGGRVDIERPTHPLHHGQDVVGTEHPANAQGGQAVNLRKSSGHNDIAGTGDQLHAGLVVIAPHIFRIGCVQHQNDILWQALMQAPHFAHR